MSAARLAGLFVYPVKSAGGIAAAEWELDDFGLAGDRRWGVVNAAGDVITQRTHRRLALVRPRFTPTHLEVDAPAMSTLRLELARRDARRIPVVIWRDRCAAEPCGAEANAWWSEFLGEPCHLVRMPEDTRRSIQPSRAAPGGRVSFADAFPLLVISEAALESLNARIESPLPMNRFRPNLVVAGVGPHAEDRWDSVRVGAIELTIAKPCDRCVMTTIDQDTAVAGKEPLRTLAGYRRWPDGSVMFGQNAVHRAPGTLRVGDAVVPTPLA